MIERPEARYGRQRQARRAHRATIIALTALAVVTGVAVAVTAWQRLGTSEVEGELGAYELLDDETVSVTVTVTREDPSQPAVCIVRARSLDGTETGRREVLVPASSESTIQVTTTVKSSRRPVVGDIYGCGTNVPAYLTQP